MGRQAVKFKVKVYDFVILFLIKVQTTAKYSSNGDSSR